MVRSSGPLEFPGTVRSKRRRTRIGRPFPFFLPGAGVSDLETALARSCVLTLNSVIAPSVLAPAIRTGGHVRASELAVLLSYPANGPSEQAFAS